MSDSDFHTIRSARLDLQLLSPEALRLTLEEDSPALEEALWIAVPAEWYAEKDLVRLRLDQLKSDPEYQPWSLRAISLRDRRQMIGYIHCHTKPCDPYLHDVAPQGVEYGLVQAAIEPLGRDLGFAYHGLRVRNTGYRTLVEVHLLFPFAVTLGDAHRRATVMERHIAKALDEEAEVVTHLESLEDHAAVHHDAH